MLFFLAQALVPPPVLFCSCSERSKCAKAGGKGQPGWRQTMDTGKHMAHRWSEEGKAFRTMLLPFLPVALGSIWGFPCAWSQSPHHYSREHPDESKAHLGWDLLSSKGFQLHRCGGITAQFACHFSPPEECCPHFSPWAMLLKRELLRSSQNKPV